MKRLSRRSFITGTAAVVATPALPATALPADVDVVVIGAGAAGIAAARRLVAAGRRIVVLEAADRVGGRCVTDSRIFDVVYDLGAHWIHLPDINPLAKLAPKIGLDVLPAPPGQRLRIGRRDAREGEMEDFLAGVVRARRAIEDTAQRKVDITCEQALPKDLAEWRQPIEFFLGPFGHSKDLAEISTIDFSKSMERDVDAFCRQGLGTLLAMLANGLPIEVSTPATQVNVSRGTEIETMKGKIRARAVIVTASTNVLTASKIRFIPNLPKRQLDALERLRLGIYERIALDLSGNPLGLQRDDLVFEKAESIRTAALLANVSGTTLTYVDVGGAFGHELAAQGPDAMIAFAVEWLGRLYGIDLKKSLRRSHATQWGNNPWVLGASSVAAPGAQWSRKALMEPFRDRVFFAGEAVHETLWGTIGGAWESGERAADAALKLFRHDGRSPRSKR